MDTEIFAYFVERETGDVSHRILIQDWESVVDCLNGLSGIDDRISIYRMPICKK